MSRLALTAVWLVVCLTTSLRAQTSTVRAAVQADSVVTADKPSGSADVLLVAVDLIVGTLEPIRLFLQQGQAYRAELSRSDVSLEFRTPTKRIQAPFFSALEGQSRPSAERVFEIYPRADAVYEMRIIGGRLGALTTIKLYRDVSASETRQKIIASPGSEIGVEVSFGMHSGYPITRPSFSRPAPIGETGADVDLCFSVRPKASSRHRFSGCAVGVGYQSRPDAESSVVWVFTEPRLRIVGGRPDQSAFEAGILARVGIGIVSSINVNPVSVAPGIYLARQIRREGDRGGWNVIASYARLWISGTDGAQSNRFAIGLGRF
jgi:hypothetical protein